MTLDAVALDYLSPVGAENPWVRYLQKWGEGLSKSALVEMASFNLIHIKF